MGMDFANNFRRGVDDAVSFCGIDDRRRMVEFRLPRDALEVFAGRSVDGADKVDLEVAFDEFSSDIFRVAGHCLLTAVPMVITADMARKLQASRLAEVRPPT
jgi:hypothetical protein